MQRAGAETLLMNLYRNLDKENYQFDFIYFTNVKCDYDDEIENLGGVIYRIISKKSSNKLVRVLKRYIDYNRLLKNLSDHQIVHSHINLNGALFLLIAKWNKKSIRISHSHISSGKKTIFSRLYRFTCRKIIKKSSNVYMACGEAAGKYLYPSIPEKNVIVFPNSIEIENFQKKEKFNQFLRDELEIDEDVKIITQIGRFTYQKNFEFTIDLIEHLTRTDKKLHFVFLGTGPYEERLKIAAKEKKIEKYITFYGISSEIPKILHSSDLFIMPSRLEGFPVVLVEAQACGIPCLISDNISKEVDMGLNLISFLSLSDTLNIWSRGLYASLKKKSNDFEKIKRIMKSKNFDASDSSKKLQEIYNEVYANK